MKNKVQGLICFQDIIKSDMYQLTYFSAKTPKQKKKKVSEAYLGSEDFQGEAAREEGSPEK